MLKRVTALILVTVALGVNAVEISRAQSFTARNVTDRIFVVEAPGGGEDQLVIASARGLVVFDSFWSRITAQKYKDGIGAALGRNDFYLTVNTVERLDMFGGNAAYENTIIGHSNILERYKGKEDEVNAEIKRLIEMWRRKENAAKERLKSHAPGSQAEATDRSWAATCKQRADELETGFSLVLPTAVYSDRETVDLGDMTLELVWFGRAGYDGMTIAIIPEEKTAIISGFIMHSHHLAPHPNPKYVRLDVPRWIEVLSGILEGAAPCEKIVCDINNVWSRERALTHLEYIRRLWAATKKAEAAGKSLEQVEEQLSLENDFAFVKDMQVYKDRGDEWIRPQHESHVRVFYLQHKHMASDALRKGLENSPRTAVADIRRQRDSGSDIYFDEASINDLGYELLTASRTEDAIAVFELNLDLFPGSANAHDSLAEACLKVGDKPGAVKHYEKSLELDPKNENARNKLAELRDK